MFRGHTARTTIVPPEIELDMISNLPLDTGFE